MRLITLLGAFIRRVWLTWRYIDAMHDTLRVAWNKARRKT